METFEFVGSELLPQLLTLAVLFSVEPSESSAEGYQTRVEEEHVKISTGHVSLQGLIVTLFYYHPQIQHGSVVGRICLCVCSAITFESRDL